MIIYITKSISNRQQTKLETCFKQLNYSYSYAHPPLVQLKVVSRRVQVLSFKPCSFMILSPGQSLLFPHNGFLTLQAMFKETSLPTILARLGKSPRKQYINVISCLIPSSFPPNNSTRGKAATHTKNTGKIINPHHDVQFCIYIIKVERDY